METLISLHPKTAEEKLLFANSYIAELLEENKKLSLEKGILQSDLAELKHQMKQEHLGALILKQKNQANLINDLRTKLRKVSLDNEKMITKIAQFQIK